MAKFMFMIIVVALGLALSACNTMHGLGQDVERGGEKVQDAATGTQKNTK